MSLTLISRLPSFPSRKTSLNSFLTAICVKTLNRNSNSINKRLLHLSAINGQTQKKTSNLSAILYKKDDLRLEEFPMPKEPAANEVLLKTLCVGICGSDIHYWKHGYIGHFVVKDPIIMGHETSAEVLAVGNDVDHLKVGDRVCCEPAVPCLMCNTCKEGHYNLCGEMLCHATPPYHGTLTQYFLHPADFCFKLPDDMSNEEGAMIEPLAVAVYSCRRSGMKAGDALLVTGAGPIGLFLAMSAKAFGVHKVIVLDINEKRLNLAKQIGADDTMLVTKDMKEEHLIQEVQQKFGRPIDVTVECSGAPNMVRLGMQATKENGLVLITGLGPREMNLPMASTAIREVTIVGSFRYRNVFPLCLALASSGRVKLKPLISHRFNFDQTLKAFETAFSGEGVKVMIKVND